MLRRYPRIRAASSAITMGVLAAFWLFACVTAVPPKTDVDADEDGAIAEEDCDDHDPGAHPGGTESCNGIDDDCDGAVDEGDAAGATAYYWDADKDGFGALPIAYTCVVPEGYSALQGDCDDRNANVNPSAVETCATDFDDDCDGETADVTDAPAWYDDLDGDGYGAGTAIAACEAPEATVADGTDCDEGDASVHPGADEVCGNGADDDCDGTLSGCSEL